MKLRSCSRSIVIVLLLLLSSSCSGIWGPEQCAVCARPLHDQTFYEVRHEDGSVLRLCCPRCGLHYQAGAQGVESARVADYYSRELIPAELAVFVESSRVMLCCEMDGVRRDLEGVQYQRAWDRCMPSLVGFQTLEAAERFRAENGGVIRRYSELLAEETG